MFSHPHESPSRPQLGPTSTCHIVKVSVVCFQDPLRFAGWRGRQKSGEILRLKAVHRGKGCLGFLPVLRGSAGRQGEETLAHLLRICPHLEPTFHGLQNVAK